MCAVCGIKACKLLRLHVSTLMAERAPLACAPRQLTQNDGEGRPLHRSLPRVTSIVMAVRARPRPTAKQPLSFELSKRNALSKLDKSPKGSIDAPIAAFIAALNAHDDYVTTSCCSGRIALFQSSTAGRGGRWLLVEHRTVSFDEVVAIIRPDERDGGAAAATAASEGVVSLKVEPAILHVQCRDLASARRLLAVALAAGFRESGLVLSEASAKHMLAIRTTSNGLEMPVAVASTEEAAGGGGSDATRDGSELDGGLRAGGLCSLVSREYLRFVVDLANTKFGANAVRVAGLEAAFAEMVQKQLQSAAAAAAATPVLAAAHNVDPRATDALCVACDEPSPRPGVRLRIEVV